MSPLHYIPNGRAGFKKLYTYIIFKDYSTCSCIQSQVSKNKTGYNDPFQTENARISGILTNNLGGKITFGNFGIPVQINSLGRAEGQVGGSLKALRNKF
jgi:hypothetical protein